MTPPLLLTTEDQDLALIDINTETDVETNTETDVDADPETDVDTHSAQHATTHLIRQGGFGRGYGWPVWSPDGSRALVSYGWREAEGDPHLDLLSITIPQGASGEPRFSNAEGHRQPIAPGVMHYAHWSPDGQRAIAVARSGGGLTLTLLAAPATDAADAPDAPDPTDATDATTLADPDPTAAWSANALIDAAPMFCAWSPDGTQLAVHAGPQLVLFDPAAVAEPRRVLADQSRFRTPAWSPDGEALYYAAPGTGQKDLLWRTQPQSGQREIVTEVDGLTAILASPAGADLALLTLSAGGLGGRDLRLIDPTTPEPRFLERGNVLGAFWSPDGAALFIVSRAGLDLECRLARYDIDSARSHELARFHPSPAYSAYLAFFDQYSLSHRLISADGRWLCLGGIVAGNGAGKRPFAPQFGCYLLPTDGSAPPRRVADAEIAFFPPPTSPPTSPPAAQASD
ncbi:MAG: WD40-like Beta Propeller Repeat/WD40-like Beta Propeller Repeat [Chloroflexi bacterium]|nr:MAG: WD40-like Beta Propeller Repeat/WD40-like Beta Propeller Repeat [Chloroflexota bacterium]